MAASPTLAPLFTWPAKTIAWGIVAYGFLASVLPVWMLLCPRDYLSTFMKIGTITLLAAGLVIVHPPLQMPAFTQFIDGSGPVFAGKLFPFVFITIACGAISGFHALIASGTTPKMLRREGDARLIGYGGMLMESFVAVMAMAAAAALDPGTYFAMNVPLAALGGSVESAATRHPGHGASAFHQPTSMHSPRRWANRRCSLAPVARPPWRSALHRCSAPPSAAG